MNGSVTYLRRLPPAEMPEGAREAWFGHVPDCPEEPHTHHVWTPWKDAPGGQVHQATQAGFALGGMEKMALHWEDPWFVTLS